MFIILLPFTTLDCVLFELEGDDSVKLLDGDVGLVGEVFCLASEPFPDRASAAHFIFESLFLFRKRPFDPRFLVIL